MSSDPIMSCRFRVEWGGTRIGFSEVSGLDVEYGVIEYREGADKEPSVRKITGLAKYGNVTLKRGIVPGDNEFWDWMRSLHQTNDFRDVTISLLNAEYEPVMTWKLRRARPARLEGPVLRADTNEIAIETLELAHEGLEIENG